ncbi:MAG: S-methyl-5-thioribose-1-phosphate isomerase [Candidatus Zixiibacteriota bacterium]
MKALERTGSKLRWIDQTKLPGQLIYKESDNYLEIINAIKCLEIRGAPAIGIAAAYGIAVASEKKQKFDLNFIEQISQEFKNARPTAVNLFWAVERIYNRYKEEGHLSIKGAKLLWSEAEAIHNEDKNMCRNIGENGAELINNNDTILTHCNTGILATGGIGTALGVIYICHKQGKAIKVVIDETRPLLQGARLTSWELLQEGIEVTLICDSTAGMMMRQGKINKVIVGADRITKNSDVINKIGTYPLAVLANKNNIPFYVAAPSSTFDSKVESGDEIIIEERSSVEITEGYGKKTAPDGVKVYSPAFDITPSNLVSYYITDKGITKGGRSS